LVALPELPLNIILVEAIFEALAVLVLLFVNFTWLQLNTENRE
jgi:hypothetical protein